MKRLLLTLLLIPALHAQDITLDSEYISATASELTISSGAVTAAADKTRFIIDTESDAASDDLDTITQSSTGQSRITLTTANDSRDVTLKDGTGNLVLGRDITIDNANDDWVELLYEGSSWYLFRTSEDIDGFAATASQVTTNTSDISTNASAITGKLDDDDNKTLFSQDSDNENTQAITADLTLSNTASNAAGKARQYLTTDADTWAAILPATSTYPRLIWNRDTTNDILIEISPSATVEATLKPGDKAYCIYVGSAWEIDVIPAKDRRSETFIISEPDAVQGLSDDFILKKFPAEQYPNGVTVIALHIDASSAYTSEIFLFEHWDDASGTTQATVESITASAISTEDDGTLSDATIPADYFLMVNFDDTPEDVAYVAITVIYDID